MPASDSTFSALTARVRELTRRLGLAGFGQWWAEQLWSFVPAGARASVERRRARPVLAFDGNVATLWRPQVNGRLHLVEAARIPLDGAEATVIAAGRTAFATLARQGAAAAQVIVALPPRAVLRKSLTLPAAIEDDLRPALAYDLDRHTPFKGDELYFDAAVVDRDVARNALSVELVAARRTLVDPMLRHAQNFGAQVIAVVAEPPERAATSRVNLLPDDRRVTTPSWARWQVALPTALLVVLALTALILPLWQKRQEAIALINIAEAARHRAEASDALRSELERKIGDYNFALQRKYAYPGTVQVLDDVTRILPDDTWLTQLEFHTGRGKAATRDIVLRGESANAGRLVALLQDSKLFTQAAPRSPTTKIQPGPGEIFDVGAQIVASRAPEARPLDMTGRAVAPVRVLPAPAPGRPAAAAPTAPTQAGRPAAGATAGPAAGASTGGRPATGAPAVGASAPPKSGTAPPGAVPAAPATAGAVAPPAAQPALSATQAPQPIEPAPAPVAPQSAPPPAAPGQPQFGPVPGVGDDEPSKQGH